jgi:hypothetical protein
VKTALNPRLKQALAKAKATKPKERTETQKALLKAETLREKALKLNRAGIW